jgi:transcriptional regulator with XRE-family HTH domain
LTTALRRARAARGWSQTQLALRLSQAASTQGDALPGWESMKRQIARWEAGQTAPDLRYRLLLSQVYGASAVDLGFPSESTEGAQLGLDFHERADAIVSVVTELWEADVDRRQFLRGAAWAVAGYAAPVAVWGTSTAQPLSRMTGRTRLGAGDLAVLRDMASAYRRADNRSGGGAVRERLVRTLHHELTPLLKHGRYDRTTGTALHSLAAEMTQLAGWMAYDCGLHGLSQRYLVQALALARSANDVALGGEILAAMAHQSAYLGHDADAVQAAQAAASAGRRAGQLHLVAEAAVLEAQGHARGRNDTAVTEALGRAEQALDRATQGSASPHYLTYMDEAYLSAKFGHVFRALGDGAATVRHATRSLVMRPGYERGRVFNLALLAHGHALSGDVEEAVRVGSSAADEAQTMTSARAVSYVRDVAAALKPYGADSSVATFRKRARYLRTA